MRHLTSVLILLFLLCETLDARWQALGGPAGAVAHRFVVMDDQLIANNWTGLFRKTIEGPSWRPVSYAGVHSNGIFDIRFHQNRWFMFGRNAIYRSDDSFESFQQIRDLGRQQMYLSAHVNRDYLMLMAWEHLEVSRDQGESWLRIDLPTGYNPRAITAVGGGIPQIAIDDRFVLLSTGDAGVLRSIDGGLTYLRIEHGMSGQALMHAFTIRDNDILFACEGGLARSLDEGQSWQVLRSGLPQDVLLSSLTIEGDLVLAGTVAHGCFLFDMATLSWRALSREGLPRARIWDLAPLDDQARNVVASVDKIGLFRLDDSGIWHQDSEGFSPVASVQALHCDSEFILASVEDMGLFSSENEGDSFRLLPASLELGLIRALARQDDQLVAGTETGVFRSEDLGQSWRDDSAGLPHDASIESLLALEATLIAGTAAHGLFYRDNSAAEWRQSAADLPPNGRIVVLGAAGGRVWAGLANGDLYRSDDNGLSWQQVVNFHSDGPIRTLSCDGEVVMIGGEDGLFVSSDRGATWQRSNDGLPHAFTNSLPWIESVAATPDLLLAAVYKDGIFASADGGASWRDVSAGLYEHSHYRRMKVCQGQVYAATLGHVPTGIVKRSLAEIHQLTVGVDEAPQAAASLDVGANPGPGPFAIRLNLQKDSDIRLELFDGTGNRRREIFQGHLPAGEHRLQLDGKGLAGGIYFCRMEFGSGSAAAAIHVVR